MINLIPDHIKVNNKYALKNIKLVRYTAIYALTILAIGMITALGILNMKSTEKELQKQIEEQNRIVSSYKPLEAEGKKLSEQLSTIDTLLKRQITFSSLLPELAKIMPKGAILKQLDLSANDILPGTSTSTQGGVARAAQQDPFVIQAAVSNRDIAATLLENIKASKDLFKDADLVEISQSTKGLTPDANSLPSVTVRYPYQVTINAYLNQQALQKNSTSTSPTGSPAP